MPSICCWLLKLQFCSRPLPWLRWIMNCIVICIWISNRHFKHTGPRRLSWYSYPTPIPLTVFISVNEDSTLIAVWHNHFAISLTSLFHIPYLIHQKMLDPHCISLIVTRTRCHHILRQEPSPWLPPFPMPTSISFHMSPARGGSC